MPARSSRDAHLGPLLVVFVLILSALLGLLLLGPPAAPATLTCPQEVRDEVRLPPRPDRRGGISPALIASANKLASHGRLDAAERLYDRALALDPPDERAGLGLAYVAARRASAVERAEAGERTRAAGHREEARSCFLLALEDDRGNQTARDGLEAMREPDTRSLVERLADGWDSFYERWLAPAARSAVPFIAALAILLVLARLLTPVVVPGDAPAWRDLWRRVAWWTGLGLVVVAALRATAFSGRPASALERMVTTDYRVVVVGALVAVALLVTARSRSGRWQGPAWWFLVLGVVLVMTTALGRLTDGVPVGAWPFALSLALALLGVVLLAAGRGHALRLQVTVKKGDAVDQAATAYVLARLEDLGSAPPRGLKAPQQVDVQDLPSSALSSLPAGKIAAALAPVVGLLSASVPWRAVVVGGGEPDELVVTVSRNGAITESAVIRGSRLRPVTTPATSDAKATVDPSDLLTAAAALVLTALSRVHPRLREGLCGATRWESVAAYVVATKPPESRGGRELRRELLAIAVDEDPDNSLAWLAYLRFLGEDSSTVGDHVIDAVRVQDVVARIPPEPNPPWWRSELRSARDDGWTAFRLRTWHTIAAAWLNAAAIAADAPITRGQLADAAVPAIAELRRLASRTYADEHVREFAAEFRDIVDQFEAGIQALKEEPGDALAACLRDADPARPRDLVALYDRACVRAYAGSEALALHDLRLAAGLMENREAALTDPWLVRLRESAQGKPFWDAVGVPTPSFTELPFLGEKGAALKALGITGAADLVDAARGWGGAWGLARRLGVPLGVVDRWIRLAELARPPAAAPDEEWLGPRTLGVLAQAGVVSTVSLKAAAAVENGAKLAKDLDAAADRLKTYRLTGDEKEAIGLRAV